MIRPRTLERYLARQIYGATGSVRPYFGAERECSDLTQ